MSSVMTKDGVVHKGSAGPEGPTTYCGLDEPTFVATHQRITCSECLKVDCPKCGQRVEIEVIHGRRRRVTMTVVHIKPGPAAVVCHAILKTEENPRER